MGRLESKQTRCQGFIFFHKINLPFTSPHTLHLLSFECLFTYISESDSYWVTWGEQQASASFPGFWLIENTPKLIQLKNFCSHGPSFVLYKRLSRLENARVCKSISNTQLQCSVNSSTGEGKIKFSRFCRNLR